LKNKRKLDEFLIARIKLTFFYSITAIIILGGSSLILYKTLLSNLSDSVHENVIDINVAYAIIDRTKDILQDRFIVVNTLIVFFIIIIGFLLTEKTLKPIKDSMENTLVEMKEFSELSNQLLDVSKNNNKRNQIYHDIFLADVVNGIATKIKKLADEKDIMININVHHRVYIKGNSSELSRVFNNVLNNAITNTPNNGTITISDEISSKLYKVNITDTGVGISKDILNKIFDPFFRGDTSRHTEGAGLGLTITKNIIENHNGTISIKSEVNKGTTIILSLPISSS